MRDFDPPFLFDLDSIIRRVKHLPARIDGVSINLPFVTINVKADSVEKKVAREIVIRLADKRVLNVIECCDNCIKEALASLQEIRSLLVDKQVELANLTNEPLYMILEAILEGIRQFLTYEQRLYNSFYDREKYFAALEMLRRHLYRCLIQISKIGEMEIPRISNNMRYNEEWQLVSYKQPELKD